MSFTPYKIIKHQDLPFITCTPDGELEETATGRLGGLEIKTTEILSSTGWTHWKGRIPTEYYAQVCQQMLAAGWQFVELLAQTNTHGGGRGPERDPALQNRTGGCRGRHRHHPAGGGPLLALRGAAAETKPQAPAYLNRRTT